MLDRKAQSNLDKLKNLLKDPVTVSRSVRRIAISTATVEHITSKQKARASVTPAPGTVFGPDMVEVVIDDRLELGEYRVIKGKLLNYHKRARPQKRGLRPSKERGLTLPSWRVRPRLRS